MRFALIFLTTALASALPPLEELRSLLGSQSADEREAITSKLWRIGREAIPALEKLTAEEDPEVSLRADFVLQRLRMGLLPESPEELLALAEAVDQAPIELRSLRLAELLENPGGALVAVQFLDTWLSDEKFPAEQASNLARVVTESILEQRGTWKDFLKAPLSAPCRGAIVAQLSWQDLPMKHQMISRLAWSDTRTVYECAKDSAAGLEVEARRELGRVAVAKGEIPLGLRILTEDLDQATTSEPARSLAFLEQASGSEPSEYKGKWSLELNLFRARVQRNLEEVKRLASLVKKDPVLVYESHLLGNGLTLPQNDDLVQFSSEEALSAVHTFFASPPGVPDIEALTSSVLIDWTVLARSLTLLAHPVEAAEKLSGEGNPSSAIRLLWRSGRQEEAVALGEEILSGLETRDHNRNRVRLTLASLYLAAEELEKARSYFEPLIFMGIQRDDQRRSALALGLKLFPRDKMLPLATGLWEKQAFQRADAIPPFLDMPGKVAAAWYEHTRSKNPQTPPAGILKEVERFLEAERDQATELIAKELAESTKAILLPSDTLYQQVLFLRLPEALEIVEKAAWYQLSIEDLTRIVQDGSWPDDIRKKALTIALEISPLDITLRWYDEKLNQQKLPVDLRLLSLGQPGLALEIGRHTGQRASLKEAADLADITNYQAIRCLKILGESYLKIDDAAEASRLLQASLCGELATGVQPATPIGDTLEALASYFTSRKLMAATPKAKEVWTERLKMIGQL